MPVIDQLRNFIRHGKQAKDGPSTSSTTTSPVSPATGFSNEGSPASSSSPPRGSVSSASGRKGGAGAAVAAGEGHRGSIDSADKGLSALDSASPQFQQFAQAPSAQSAAVAASIPQIPSPGAMANTHAQDTYGVHAQKMVQDEKAQKSQMPSYPGLERFRLIEKMGDGAFSNVYKAVDRETGQKVALKVVRKYELNHTQGGKHLNPDFKKKQKGTERANILKEVQIMRNLHHPGIVKLLAFSESKDYYYLVLELLEGGELFHQIVRLTYFSEELSRHVIVQVAQGIRYLHEEKGVVHRDIKPENLLFEPIPFLPSKAPKIKKYDEDKEDEGEFAAGYGGGGIGKIKIADFGLSKVVWNEETMTPCGTVGYTAPEIVKDERYSKSVDMWALGCVLYTLLCGFPPFYDESINVLTEKVAKGYYTFLSPWWDDISSSAKDLITHLLIVDPEKRYTIDEFLAHPWIANAPESVMAARVPFKQTVEGRTDKLTVPGTDVQASIPMPMDSPMLASLREGRASGMKSPGMNVLKEAFDISYAVHRMEEEGARRRAYNGPGGAGAAGFLHGLNEEDENDDDVGLIANAQAARAAQGQSQAASSAAQAQHRGTSTAAAAAAAAQAYPGKGGANAQQAAASLYDGRAGPRDHTGRGAFELNMDGSTLLGRRGKQGASGIKPLSTSTGAGPHGVSKFNTAANGLTFQVT